MSTQEYIARIHESDDGSLWAEVLDLPGCFATGRTLAELREALEEAISMCRSGGSGPAQAGRGLQVGEMRLSVPA